MRILDYNFIDGNNLGLKEPKTTNITQLYNKLSALETNNFKTKINEIVTNFNELIIPEYDKFKFVKKGFGNVDLNNFEVGDVFEGWNDLGLWLGFCIYNGGDLFDSANFTKIRDYTPQIHVPASTTILPSWNGAIVIITTAGVVLTLPADLPVIRFKIVTRPTATCDFTLTTPKVWVNGTPTLIPEKTEVDFFVDNLNSNEVYVSKPNATQPIGLEIIDPIPSIEVIGTTQVLIKEYDLGFLTDKKLIECLFLFNKVNTAVTQSITAKVRLFDTITNTEVEIGNHTSQTNTYVSIPINCVIDGNVIRVVTNYLPAGAGNYDTSATPLLQTVINVSNSFKLRVYIANNNTTATARQFLGKINLK